MCDSCSDGGIANGPAPVASGGSSQWTGTVGNPIYYANPVGIGSPSTPTATLMVTGNIYASNSLTTTNIFVTEMLQGPFINLSSTSTNIIVGLGAMSAANPSNGGDIAIGANALQNDTAAGNNTAIGTNAMSAASPTQGGDIAIGQYALYTDTRGGNNTALGSYAMRYANPVNGGDAAIGLNALLNDNGIGNNTAIGANAMQNASPANGGDVAIGLNALLNDNGIGNNTAIGANAMLNASPTQGGDIAIGQYALLNDTATGNNTAIGANAMRNASPTQGGDIAIGRYALSTDTGGGNNTALGSYAMQDASSPYGGDVAIGWCALQNDTGGGTNTAIGYNPMLNASPSYGSDVAIGEAPLQHDNGVGNNVAIGTLAMRNANPVQGEDVGIGKEALKNDAGQGYNVAIGSNSMASLTTGSYNTALGYNSAALMDGLSNTVSIGAFATPLASNVAVFPLEVNVGINTGLPRATLEVSGNIYASNSLTTSEIICNAFTTSTATNWNYISNAASARSTSVGWKGIRQVFGDHITSTVYVYNNAVLETTLSYIAPGFGAFVAVGGLNDEIIVVSGVDAFFVYYFDGLIWNGPRAVDTTRDIGVYNTLWMPSLSASIGGTVTLVIGGYGYSSAPGVGNPGVGVYSIRTSDGSKIFVGEITPSNSVGTIYRNTVAISGDGTTIAIGQQDSSILYVYSIGDFRTPVFFDSSTDPGDEYYVSIDYYGQIILLTLNGSVRMYSNSLTPV